MIRAVLGSILIACAAGAVLAEDVPKFEAADVHVSPKPANFSPISQFPRTSPVRGGRYEIKNASMADLVRIAYGFDADKILGGPNWLELDRYDLAAKLPNETTPETQKLMLQALLGERFKLAVHKDTKPLPSYALVAGRKPQMKEAAGTEETGCHPQTSSAAPSPEGGVSRLMMMGPDGKTTTLTLGPGMTVTYECRNVTMQQFVGNLRGMIGANLGTTPLTDGTGLKGAWNFDLRYSMSLMGGPPQDQSERIPLRTAIEKQLGLKMEEREVPTPVLVVDSVERTPADNPPGTAEALPAPVLPTEFEVASVKPTPSDRMMGRFSMQPGGRLVAEGMPIRFLIQRAFNTNNSEQIVGLTEMSLGDRYDINAKTPPGSGMTTQVDNDALAPLMLNLLKDRFKMTYHTENREITAYALSAAKPKLKKADPNSRIRCKSDNPPAGSPSGSRMFTCQNVTMALFAERLQGVVPELQWPVADATGIEGSYDVSVVFQMRAMMAMRAGGPGAPPPPLPPGGGIGGGTLGGMVGGVPAGGGPGGAAMPSASDPIPGQTIFEALEKQLGLKLEKQKRSMPVIVIDHLEPKPTEN
jgi:uncharacterized protein (TIGR03435 family)